MAHDAGATMPNTKHTTMTKILKAIVTKERFKQMSL